MPGTSPDRCERPWWLVRTGLLQRRPPRSSSWRKWPSRGECPENEFPGAAAPRRGPRQPQWEDAPREKRLVTEIDARNLPLWAVAAGIILAALAVFFLYRRERGLVPRRSGHLLTGLRILEVSILLLLAAD